MNLNDEKETYMSARYRVGQTVQVRYVGPCIIVEAFSGGEYYANSAYALRILIDDSEIL